MRGVSSITQPKKKFLRSKRLDISQYDTPELKWSFYDSYTKSNQAMVAIEHGQNSIQGYNLDKYLEMTKSFTKIPSMSDIIENLPTPFNELLALQHDSGIFESLPAVLKVLHLPKWLSIARAENTSQTATAFAIAAMRQRIDLFDQLQNSHDLAVKWVHHGLVLEANHLIADYTLTPEEYLLEYPPVADVLISAENTSQSQNGEPDFLNQHQEIDIQSKSAEVSTTSTLPQLRIHEQEMWQRKITETEISITQRLLELDCLLEEVKLCQRRCVSQFLSTELLAEKNAAFDELTCMLGDGVPPREGYIDWRKDGVRGVRPIIVGILCSIHSLSELRLSLEECRTEPPSLSVMHLDNTRYFSNDNRGRWAFHYNGTDAVHKILHCLDFLRTCRELSSWYGRKYWFWGNPLQLPFNYSVGFSALDMSIKVRANLRTKPHQRQIGSTHEDAGGIDEISWDDHQFFTSWSQRFTTYCNSTWQWNWPTVPNTKKVESARELHTSLLVIYCGAAEDIEKTVLEETEFMNLVKAGRGDHLMVGKSGMKPNRKVRLPSDEVILKGIASVLEGAQPDSKGPSMRVKRTSKSAPRRLAALK